MIGYEAIECKFLNWLLKRKMAELSTIQSEQVANYLIKFSN